MFIFRTKKVQKYLETFEGDLSPYRYFRPLGELEEPQLTREFILIRSMGGDSGQ